MNVAATLLVVGAAVTVAGSALPWGASGNAERSSYELVGVVDRLRVLDGTAASLAPLWHLLPLLAAAVVVAALAGRPGAAKIVGTAMGVPVVGLAVAVDRSPLLPRAGVGVALAGIALVVAGIVVPSTFRLPLPGRTP